MMATAISKISAVTRWKFIAGIFLLVAGIIFADEGQRKIFTARAQTEYQQARVRYEADTANTTNAWQFARAAFDFAEFATSDGERATRAEAGIAVCRQVVAREPTSAAAHYYLAMNLGQLARTKFLGALKLVREMEREFKTAGELEPQFDYAGPERNLGHLYREAPGWPASIGNKRTAHYYLEQAVNLVPDYPGNRLTLIESYLIWNEPDAAKRELKALDEIWPAAQTSLTGEKWEPSWVDWSTRRDDARKKIKENEHEK